MSKSSEQRQAVSSDLVTAACRPEWVVQEGFVAADQMPAAIALRGVAASALKEAGRRLLESSHVLNEYFGSFSGPLSIYLLAGHRALEDNSIVVPSIAMYRWAARNHFKYNCNLVSVYPRINVGSSLSLCLDDINAHRDGNSVDVALVYGIAAPTLLTRSYLYGFYSSDYTCEPTAFSGTASTRKSEVQLKAADDLLVRAMGEVGFDRPNSKLPWHFEFSKAANE